ncbi:MAG: hypothetical protein AUJ58_08285 [Zetaproteobacteria bacterium CG1_02_55_237]|nr:MAG: hypothetical protein AUJ58_08285 [Zetaproteobacteria bacterium CG1_02_55_237]
MWHFSLWLLLFCLPVVYAQAASAMDFKVAVQGDVLSCNAVIHDPPEGMSRALSEGSEISVEWKISVVIERKYWLNNTVASVLVNRQVVPDLVSRSWKLEDLTSGITRRVFSLEEAIKFLTTLSDFPVVDRSLLSSGQAYVVAVTVSEWEGKRRDDFWASWFGTKSGTAATELLMP